MKAFPNVTNEKGMDLRDYFAIRIMQMLMRDMNPYIDSWNAHEEADIAYEIADAMIEMRTK